MTQKIRETTKDGFPSFNKFQKSEIVRTAVSSTVTGATDDEILDSVMKVVSRFERRQDSRKKKNNIKDLLQKEQVVKAYPIVFFICSKHANCAEDHTAYEGKVYYDRFWRTKYKEQPEWIVSRIQKFIEKNKLLSLQYITKGPVWLSTRPYCKHYFTACDTLSVLTHNIEAPITHGKRLKRGQSRADIKKRLEKTYTK